MAKLIWDAIGDRLYETGVKHAVLYPVSDAGTYGTGVAWNGVTAVNENPSGADSNPFYADDIKYLDLRGNEEFGATIEAYTYPDEFSECDGSKELTPGVYIGQQARKMFGLAYETIVGNDVKKEAYGKKLHLIYGCTASPSQKNRTTVNESPEAMTFSWELTTTPVAVDGCKPTSHLIIDSTKVGADKFKLIEDALHGSAEGEPRLLLPNEVKELLTA